MAVTWWFPGFRFPGFLRHGGWPLASWQITQTQINSNEQRARALRCVASPVLATPRNHRQGRQQPTACVAQRPARQTRLAPVADLRLVAWQNSLSRRRRDKGRSGGGATRSGLSAYATHLHHHREQLRTSNCCRVALTPASLYSARVSFVVSNLAITQTTRKVNSQNTTTGLIQHVRSRSLLVFYFSKKRRDRPCRFFSCPARGSRVLVRALLVHAR